MQNNNLFKNLMHIMARGLDGSYNCPQYKRKGNMNKCSSYQGILLYSVPRTLYGRNLTAEQDEVWGKWAQ